MNIIYINWDCFGGEDAVQALNSLGHHVYITQMSEQCHTTYDEIFAEKLKKLIKEENTDIVFSFNYFPMISQVCEEVGCKYLAWVYDNPSTKVYDKSIKNECNYVAIFDSAMVKELQSQGVETVHYVPMAVNVKRMQNMKISDQDIQRFAKDISFVGSFYDEEHNFYDRLVEKSKDKELQGYLDGVLEAQKRIYGYNFMAECLNEDVLKKIRSVLPYRIPEGSYLKESQVYSDYYLARRLTYLERTELLFVLGELFPVSFYTHREGKKLGKAENCGKIHYFNEMPKLFRLSKINLNPTLRSIKSGIPLRAMDIMGAGGFLMTNYQEDFFKHFDPEVHFSYYTSLEEAVEKVNYYLKHEEERKRIAENAWELILKEHSYEKRFLSMFSDMEKKS